jgi:hypothetical protein
MTVPNVTDPSAVIVTASAAQPPAPSAPAAPVATPAPTVTPNVGEPDWLNGRIAQAKQNAQTELLKTIGVDSVETAKAAVTAAAAKAESEKTAELRAAEWKAKLDGETAKTTAQQAVINEYAGRQMIGLTAEQKAAVMAIAGDDAGAQLRAISALQPTWKTPDAPAAVVTAAPAPAAAVNTAPGHTAPGGAGGTSPPNHRAAYEHAQKNNPFAAAEYGLRNAEDVYKPRT